MKVKSRKGITIEDLQTIALTFVMIGVIAGVGLLITTSLEQDSAFKCNITDDRTGCQGSAVLNNSTRGIGNLTARLPLIGTVAGFVVLLGFVVAILVRRNL